MARSVAPKGHDALPQCDFYIFTHISNEKNAMRYVDEHAEALCRLLAHGPEKGILILYVAPGMIWRHMVELVNGSEALRNVSRTPKQLDIVREAQKESSRLAALRKGLEDLRQSCREKMGQVEGRCAALRDLRRIRIVSPLDLNEILENIKSRMPVNFKHWFQQTSYDTPKIVGAILRLRGIGTSIPVLRFDEDVLFNNDTLANGMESIRNVVVRSVTTFQERRMNYWTQAWVFSAQYVHVGLPTTTAESRRRYQPWGQAFATRCTPALLATPELCNVAQFQEQSWTPNEEHLDEAIDESIMMKFYGLVLDDNNALQLAVPSATSTGELAQDDDIARLGMTYIGANPMRACVSGAGLCIPPGLNLDLPPFTHFSQNVMWIDDHCLHALTREVEGRPVLRKSASLGNVVKARGTPTNCAWYTLEAYLPALLYGCVMDAWINNCPGCHLLKYPLEDLPPVPALHQTWHALSANGEDSENAGGPLSSQMRHMLSRGVLQDKEEEQQFRQDLWDAALQRIQDVYWQWSRLVGSRTGCIGDTFASMWASSSVSLHRQLGRYCDVPWSSQQVTSVSKRKLRLGAGLVHPLWHEAAKTKSRSKLPPLHMTDLNPHVAKAIGILVEDTVTHLEWVLAWPSVVQAVRSVKYGGLPSDVMYGCTLATTLPTAKL